MRANTPGFVGERLVQARRSLGLSGIGMAQLLGVSATTVSQYERNKQSPRPEIMDRICEKLDLPRAFFLRPVPDRGDRRIHYRSLNVATKSARERAAVRFEWVREIVEYLGNYFEFPRLNVPKLSLPADFRSISHEMIEKAALECRQLWGFGEGPIADVLLALESNGIIVARGELGSDALDAFSEFLNADLPYVFLGSDKGVCVRSRFDAAHELGHLVLHREVSARDFGHPKDFRLVEGQAHRFAAAFLLPAASFLRSIWAPTLDAFRGQKDTWKVSIKGMVVRAHQLGVIDDTQYQRMLINYGRRFKDREPGDDAMKVETPRLLSRCFESLVAESIRTRDQILLDLPLQSRDIEELAALPRGFFSGLKGEIVPLPILKRPRVDEVDGPRGDVIEFRPIKASR